MHLLNFNFASSIELGVPGHQRPLDLHNIYDWLGVSYLSHQRNVRMSWALPSSGTLQPRTLVHDLPGTFVLEFRGVSRVAASPHDCEIPYDEDTCLDELTFTPAEPTSHKSRHQIFRTDCGHVEFRFRSGFTLTIRAEEAELILGQDT